VFSRAVVYRIFFIISLLAFARVLNAQQIQVINSSDLTPIESVAVFNLSRDRAAITDSLGMIELSIFQTRDTLIFQHSSYILEQYCKSDLKEGQQVLLRSRTIFIEEYVISASKYRESSLNIPYMVNVLKDQVLMETTGFTAADILEESGNILVQRTQGGGGSPILRGFEANKVLLVVDGVRLNNAIYRNGHLQNSITIDYAILERTEIIFGPSSIMYGSDALGGVIHYYTRDPWLGSDDTTHFDAQAYTQYASAMNGISAHLDFSVGKKRWSSLTSVSYKNFGDIRMGSWRDPTLGNWGELTHYVDQVNGQDSTLRNPNPKNQLNTGYKQMDILQKIRYSPSMYVDWILNMQYSTSSDIDRLDKLNDFSGGNLKYAKYYYGPQNRFLLSLKNVLRKDNPAFTNMTTLAAFQRIDEDRYSLKFRNDDLLIQQEDVMVFSLNLDLVKIWGAKHKLHYGAELTHNLVESDAWYENIRTGVQEAAQTRYPEGGSGTWSASAYTSYKWIMNEGPFPEVWEWSIHRRTGGALMPSSLPDSEIPMWTTMARSGQKRTMLQYPIRTSLRNLPTMQKSGSTGLLKIL
jgi:hemoglobin/transferrin/lactoferrin receptor protein